MKQTLYILIAGGVGSVLRYWGSTGIYWLFGRSFPYGTLFVNLLGSFVIGYLSVLLIERIDSSSSDLRALLMVGLIGGFTTFSTFSLETFYLLEDGAIWKALLNILLSVCLCLSAVMMGTYLGRR